MFKHLVRLAVSLARARAGRSIPARIAMMAMTTSSSISVKAARADRDNTQQRLLQDAIIRDGWFRATLGVFRFSSNRNPTSSCRIYSRPTRACFGHRQEPGSTAAESPLSSNDNRLRVFAPVPPLKTAELQPTTVDNRRSASDLLRDRAHSRTCRENSSLP